MFTVDNYCLRSIPVTPNVVCQLVSSNVESDDLNDPNDPNNPNDPNDPNDSNDPNDLDDRKLRRLLTVWYIFLMKAKT